MGKLLNNQKVLVKKGAQIVADDINSPSHYTQGDYEVIDVIEDWGLNYHLGNVVKYVARCEHKGNKVKDLKKAIWYLERELSKGE